MNVVESRIWILSGYYHGALCVRNENFLQSYTTPPVSPLDDCRDSDTWLDILFGVAQLIDLSNLFDKDDLLGAPRVWRP